MVIMNFENMFDTIKNINAIITFLKIIKDFLGYFKKQKKSKSILPINNLEKIGIVFSIIPEDNKVENRCKNDLIDYFKKFIVEHNLNDLINVIVFDLEQSKYFNEISQQYFELKNSKIVLNKRDSNLLEKIEYEIHQINATMFIKIKAKERNENENIFVLSFEWIWKYFEFSKHDINTIHAHVQTFFKDELKIPAINDYQGFKDASIELFITVRYLIGIIAFEVNDFNSAFQLHNHLIEEIEKLSNEIINTGNNLVTYSNIKNNLNDFLYFEIIHLIELNTYDVVNSIFHLEKALSLNKLRTEAYLLMISLQFKIGNIIKAKSYNDQLLKISKGTDNNGYFNKAFLLFFEDKFNEGLTIYKNLSSKITDNDRIIAKNCIENNLRLFEQNPMNKFIYFINSYLSYIYINNISNAYEFSQKFLESTKRVKKFDPLKKEANIILKKCKKVMDL